MIWVLQRRTKTLHPGGPARQRKGKSAALILSSVHRGFGGWRFDFQDLFAGRDEIAKACKANTNVGWPTLCLGWRRHCELTGRDLENLGQLHIARHFLYYVLGSVAGLQWQGQLAEATFGFSSQTLGILPEGCRPRREIRCITPLLRRSKEVRVLTGYALCITLPCMCCWVLT